MDQRIFKHESKFLIDFLSLSYLTLMEQSICLDDDTKKKRERKETEKMKKMQTKPITVSNSAPRFVNN